MKNKKLLRVVGFLMGGVGVILFAGVLFPIASYEIKNAHDNKGYLSPIPEVRGSDLTHASNWFPSSENTKFSSSIAYYNISIKKLDISDAVVTLGGEELSDSLIQYPDTALPGKAGNTVVFGHSALPAFYNPKDYLTIFSTLPTLKEGDEIEIVYDGINYLYRVFDKYEVFPTNLDVLSQSSLIPTLSLITCTPPGDPRSPKRLVVRASLVPRTEETNYDNTRI